MLLRECRNITICEFIGDRKFIGEVSVDGVLLGILMNRDLGLLE
jgi:hypothetical protein